MEMAQLKVLAGEVDFSRESASLVNLALYKENEKNGYTTYLTPMHVTPTDIFINQTWADGDAEYRSIVQNVKFRQALNKAIDRDEIIDTVYYGFAEPSTYADPTFDPAGAERLLQEIGMRKGSDGFYRTPTGKPFEIIFEMAADAPDIIPVTELVTEMWKAIGINTTAKRVEASMRDNKQSANLLQARVMWCEEILWFWMNYRMDAWGRTWNNYFTNTTTVDIRNDDGTTTKQAVASETPPPGVLEFQRMVDTLMSGSLSEANATDLKIKQSIRDNLWYIVPLENVKQPLIINSRIRNVAESGFAVAVDLGGEILWYDN
jgi:peptide/nickel transport system substrate-binding protein